MMRVVFGYKLLVKKNGQSLIEVLVAFAVAVIIGVGLVTATLTTQRAAASARNETQATELAQQYLEQIRVLRDSKGYNHIRDNIGCKTISNSDTLNPVDWQLTSGCTVGTAPLNGDKVQLSNVKAEFWRKVTISDTGDANRRKIVVEVTWKEGNNNRSTSAETIISKWCAGNITGQTADPCIDP